MAKVRRNPRKVVAYLTQYGGWWSATEAQWKRLAAAGMGLAGPTFQHRGETYGEPNLDKDATWLRGRPSAVRAASWTDRNGYDRRSYSSVVPVIRPLDFGPSDWRYANEEVRQYIATLERA